MTLTDSDLQSILKIVQTEVPPLIRAEVPPLVEHAIAPSFAAMKQDFDRITTSIDDFLKIVRRHEEEWLVLREQHKRMREALIKKGIVTEDEIAVS